MQESQESDFLAPIPPWAHLACCEEADIDDFVYGFRKKYSGERSTLVRIVRAEQCPTWRLNYVWWAAVLEFPGCFGYGEAAFIDCITDLSWVRSDSYILFVTRAYLLLQEENERALSMFLQSLETAAVRWAKPTDEQGGIPFHVVFHCEPDLETHTRHIYAQAGLWLESTTLFMESDGK